MACVTNGGYAAYEAVVMIGGPSAYTAYRRVRIRLGFGDPAAVPAEQPVAPPAPERPARAPAPVGRPSPASG